MKHFGNAEFQSASTAIMYQETSFPDSPSVGQLIFKDKRVYICVEIISGLPTWVPLTNEINTYLHNQTTASTTWNIQHDLATATPLVQVYNGTTMIIPNEVTVVDNNNITVSLLTATAGRAIVMYGDINGGSKSQVAYTHIQTTLSSSWVVPHNLGYYPIVRVFVGSAEVQPQSIVHDSLFQTTITFSSGQTGTARLI